MKINSPFNLTIFVFFILCSITRAQNLSTGDIAFIGFNSDNPDGFTIIALSTIPANEIIYFTDKGWLSSGGFRGYEGTITWVSPETEISSNTIISFYKNEDLESSIGTVTQATIDLAIASDQIIAYNSATNLSAIYFNGSSWDIDATNSSTSAIPTGLVSEQTAIAVGKYENAIYVGDFSGTKTEIQAKIYNPANWFSSSTPLVISEDYFPCNVFIKQSEYWNLTTNWFGNSIPSNTTNVLIPEGKTIHVDGGITASCKNLIIYPTGTLTIYDNNSLLVSGNIELKSRTSSLTGNLINKGILDVSGTTSLERYIPSTNWHIISSPVSGQKMGEFVLTNPIDSFTQDNITDYDLTFYDEGINNWSSYTSSSETTTFQAGAGYSMRKTVDSKDGIVKFTGTANSGNYVISVTKNNYGWNCIGNPYPSSLNIANDNGFLDENLLALDPLFSGVYVWNEGINDYEVITKAAYNFSPPGGESIFNKNNVAPAQGFFIKAKENGTINFTPELQNDTEATFKSTVASWPAVKLNATLNNHINSTIIAFNEQMTIEIDPMYDVGKFCGNPDFSLSSKLSSNSDLKLSVQALPLSMLNNCRIPLEVKSSTNGNLAFEIHTSNLPDDVLLYIEDSKENKIHLINFNQAFFAEFDKTEKNRFFLQFNSTTNLKNTERENPCRIINCSEYLSFNTNSIKTFSLKIYSIDGKLIFWEPNYQSNSHLSKSNFRNGLYLFFVEFEGRLQKGKLMINQP